MELGQTSPSRVGKLSTLCIISLILFVEILIRFSLISGVFFPLPSKSNKFAYVFVKVVEYVGQR